MLPFYPSYKDVNCSAMNWTIPNILTAICLAAALTAITGIDYFRKAIPYLKDDK